MHYLDYNEKINHGTPDFPIAFYHVDEHHPRYAMPFHWHKEMELIRILEGSITISLDSVFLTARAGDLILIEEGVIHGGTPEHCIYECAVFDPNLLTSMSAHTDACKRYVRLTTRHQIQLYNYFQADDPRSAPLLAAAERLFPAIRWPHAGSELLTLGALYEFFGRLFEGELYNESREESVSLRRKMDVLKPVLEYIDANYASPITLSDLSRLAGMSPKYFCRFFRAALHRTPVDYLNYYRIERACHILTTTELPVTEVAYRCGFNDSSYFVKTFRKYMGITPRAYAHRR